MRGRIYLAPLNPESELDKYWLCVSNNQRNPRLDEFIAVRATTTRKNYPTWVELTHEDPLAGYINCDDIGPIYRDTIIREIGAVTPATMRRVNEAMKLVLGLA